MLLLWAHEQLNRADSGLPLQQLTNFWGKKPASTAPSSSLTVLRSAKHRPALVAADTNIGECAEACKTMHGAPFTIAARHTNPCVAYASQQVDTIFTQQNSTVPVTDAGASTGTQGCSREKQVLNSQASYKQTYASHFLLLQELQNSTEVLSCLRMQREPCKGRRSGE